jgi:uncharacterized protein YcnI
MKTKLSVAVAAVVFSAASLSAHVMVSPTTSKAGAAQKYEVRVHNEGKVAAKSVEVEIPDGVTVTDIAKSGAGTATPKKSGERITSITWQIDVQPNKYVALAFTATNPNAAGDLHWTLHEKLADGTVVDWSDNPGSKEKGSVTKITTGQ